LNGADNHSEVLIGLVAKAEKLQMRDLVSSEDDRGADPMKSVASYTLTKFQPCEDTELGMLIGLMGEAKVENQ